jgi:hypothetical protein
MSSQSSDSTIASGESTSAPGPVLSLDDPRALQILTTEHWSLLTARTLAYNEAFTRGGMFLSFLSTSFVALALASSAMSFERPFLIIAAVVLGFDLIIGLTTYGRIIGANQDDMRAVHGMSRLRHGYTQIAPIVTPYFTTGVNDDMRGIMMSYGSPPSSGIGLFLYGLTTSGGMIGLIVALVGGVFAGVLALLFGTSGDLALIVGVAGAVVAFMAITGLSSGTVARHQTGLESLFPTPGTAGSRDGE